MEQTWDTAVAVATGQLNAQEAFIEGRILLTGDQQKLIDAQPVFGALDSVFDSGARAHRVSLRPMPELPEVQAHAERLTEQFAGAVLQQVRAAQLHRAEDGRAAAVGRLRSPLHQVGRRGKYLLLQFEPITFVVHLMQGGRLLVDDQAVGQAAKRPGPVRVRTTRPALLLTEAGQGTPGRCVVRRQRRRPLDGPPLDSSARRRSTSTPEQLAAVVRRAQHARARLPARPAHTSPGWGGCWPTRSATAPKMSPFAMTGKLGADGCGARS